MRLPDFLIIGSMKSGTTTLYHDLRAHPGVFIPVDKEVHALVSDDVRTERGLEDYASYYKPAGPGQRLGDASTGYTKRPTHENVADRAFEVLGPDLSLLYIVREPIARALSHHYHTLSWRQTDPDPDRAIAHDPCFIDYSRYAYQLEPWLERFGPDRLRVIKFEDYARDRAAGAAGVFEFLGLDPNAAAPDPQTIHNKGDNRTVHTGVFTAINRSRVYRDGLRRVIPPNVRQVLYKWFLPKAPPRPSPPSLQTLRIMQERIGEDLARLPALLGDSAPNWDLDAAIEKILSQATMPSSSPATNPARGTDRAAGAGA